MSKTEKLLQEFKELAKQVSDRKNTRIYISDTVSQYSRKKIAEMIRKEIEILIDDKELGVISEEQLEEEASLLRVIYKSL